MTDWRVIEADCIEAMREMDEASVDSIVTDPPYGLEFMGKEWDRLGKEVAHRSFKRSGNNAPRFGAWTPTASEDGIAKVRTGNLAAQEWHQAWATEALRVLKPGGHLLAFGGTRTYHRLACAVEDAGFEIRDSLIWLYGSGFPKSLDVSKAIDKARGDDCLHVTAYLREHRRDRGLVEIARALGFPATEGTHGTAAFFSDEARLARVPTPEQWEALRELLGFGEEMDTEVARLNARKGEASDEWKTRPPLEADPPGMRESWTEGRGWNGNEARGGDAVRSEAQQWQGFGTSLKPAHEPVVVARKPLAGTVAQNVLEHGTGALNVDGCRIEGEPHQSQPGHRSAAFTTQLDHDGERPREYTTAGRWPANVALSHLPECKRVGVRKVKGSAPASGPTLSATESVAHGDYNGERGGAVPSYQDQELPAYSCAPGCPVAELDRQSGERGIHGAGYAREDPGGGSYDGSTGIGFAADGEGIGTNRRGFRFGDTGGSSRFFYVAKASRAERNAGLDGLPDKTRNRVNPGGLEHDPKWAPVQAKNHHPTVKPIDLMRWLVRLVTPPGGTVLDPFTGSGTTGIAAVLGGFDFIGVEREAEYVEIAKARIAWWSKLPPGTDTEAALGLEGRERVMRDAGQLGLELS